MIAEPGNLLEEEVDCNSELVCDIIPVYFRLIRTRYDAPENFIFSRIPIRRRRIDKITSRKRESNENRVGRFWLRRRHFGSSHAS